MFFVFADEVRMALVKLMMATTTKHVHFFGIFLFYIISYNVC